MKILKQLTFSKHAILTLLLVLVVVSLLSGHWLLPIGKKQSFRVYQFDSSELQKDFYACKTIAGLTAFPNVNWEKKTNSHTTIDTQISTTGSRLSVEVEGDIAKVITNTAVEMGIAGGDEFKVLRNNVENLVIRFESDGGVIGYWSINLISINKKTGLGIWTKSALRDDLFGNPSGQVYYLECL